MDYEWNDGKCRANVRKHGIDFADAVAVFGDDGLMIMEDEEPDEQRFVAAGLDGLGRLLVVVFTWRAERIRIISARRANPTERSAYGGPAR